MKDKEIVERLRKHAGRPYNVLVDGALASDAADAIETLIKNLLVEVATSERLIKERDEALEALRDLVRAHHHSAGDEYADAARSILSKHEAKP